MTTQQYINLARYSFGISFALGTLLMLVLFSAPLQMESQHHLLIIGMFYILIAAIYNSIVFLVICVVTIIRKKDLKIILLNACIMLLNIPIALTYIIIVFRHFLN